MVSLIMTLTQHRGLAGKGIQSVIVIADAEISRLGSRHYFSEDFS